MRELPETHRHLADRPWLVRMGHVPIRDANRAVKRSLLTMDHATRCFEAAVEMLGDRALVLETHGGERRLVYLKDGDGPWIIPSAVLEHAFFATSQSGPVMRTGAPDPPLPVDAPDGWKWGDPHFDPEEPPPDILPRGPNMRGGSITMREGPSYLEVCYQEDGRRKESSSSATDLFLSTVMDGVMPYCVDPRARPPLSSPLSIYCQPELRRQGHSVQEFAAMLAALDPRPAVPALVLLPAPVPGGPERALGTALSGMRRALWKGHVPADAGWLAADGFAGTALGWGADRAAAVAMLRGAIQERCQVPAELAMSNVTSLADRRPPPPAQEPGPLHNDKGDMMGFNLGTLTLTGSGPADAPTWPEIVPGNVPIAVVPLGEERQALPPDYEAAGFYPVTLLGAFGAAHRGFVRHREGGWLLVGEGVADLLDPANIEDELRASLTESWFFQETLAKDDNRYRTVVFHCWDSGRARTTHPQARSGSSGNQPPGPPNKDEAAWTVTLVEGS